MDNNASSVNQSSQQQPALPPSQPGNVSTNRISSPVWIKTILVLVIIILIGTIGTIIYQTYQANQQAEEVPIPKASIKITSPTVPVLQLTDWKTYTKNEYNFEIKYPKNYEVKELVPTRENYIEIVYLSLYPYDILVRAIEKIDVYEKAELAMVADREMELSEYQYTIEEKTIGSYKFAIATTESKEGNQLLKAAFVKHPTKNRYIEFDISTFTIVISPGGDIKPNNKGLEEFDQILSTFQFTE